MQHSNTIVAPDAGTGISEPVAGVIAGLVAGAAYLVAQVSLSTAMRPGTVAEPLQRIAAMLMGLDPAPPPTEITSTMFGKALIIHFALSMAFGRIVSTVWRRRSGAGIFLGALAGLVLYGVNFGLIAPTAFPWFADSLRWSTAANHALFGAGVCRAAT